MTAPVPGLPASQEIQEDLAGSCRVLARPEDLRKVERDDLVDRCLLSRVPCAAEERVRRSPGLPGGMSPRRSSSTGPRARPCGRRNAPRPPASGRACPARSLRSLGGGEQPPVRNEGHVILGAHELDVQRLRVVGTGRSATAPPRGEGGNRSSTARGIPTGSVFCVKDEQIGEGALPLEEGAEHDGGVGEEARRLVVRCQEMRRALRAPSSSESACRARALCRRACGVNSGSRGPARNASRLSTHRA